MTKTEEELSKKMLHAQMLAMQSVELVVMLGDEVSALRLQIEKLQAVVDAMTIARGYKKDRASRGDAETQGGR